MRLSRIYYLSLVFMGSLALASCDDDDKVADAGVKVLSAETSFDANGGEHEISVSKELVKAYATADWLSVDAQGNVAKLTVGENGSNESRHTKVVLKASDTDSTIVNVSQLGAVFVLEGLGSSIVSVSDGAASYEYSMKHTLPVEVSSSADWLKVSATDESLKVDLTANETGHLRNGWIAYATGDRKDTISVVQYDFDQDIAGSYYLAFTNGSTGKTSALMAQLGKDEDGNLLLAIPAFGFNIPVIFDEKTCQLSISGGSYIGDYSAYKVGIAFGYTEGEEISWDSSISYPASFQYDDEDGTYAMFEDNGSYDDPVDMMVFYAFSSTDFTEDTALGALMYLIEPYLLKVDESAGAKRISFKAPAMNVLKK